VGYSIPRFRNNDDRLEEGEYIYFVYPRADTTYPDAANEFVTPYLPTLLWINWYLVFVESCTLHGSSTPGFQAIQSILRYCNRILRSCSKNAHLWLNIQDAKNID
jgi:hypothetical protein